MKINIESDGTKNGTKLTVNGTEVDFESVHFGADQWSRDIWFSYSTASKDVAEKISTRVTYTYDPSLATMSHKKETIGPDEVDFADYSKMK